MSTIQQFDFSVDLMRSILWQQSQAISTPKLLASKQAWYDLQQSEFWQNWITNVFDIRTANEFGLAVWAVILGIPTSIIQTPIQKPNFGFGAFNINFNQATFGSLGSSVIGLGLEEKRLLLRLRYYKLVSNCAIPSTNAFLKTLFADYGPVYILDNGFMTITYVFNFDIDVELLSLIQSLDVLPRPSGVKVKYVVSVYPVFGFGPFNKNFSNGTFGA